MQALLGAQVCGILTLHKQLGDDTARQWLEPAQPGPLVDIFWQAHILDMENYRKDCKDVFGVIVEYTYSLYAKRAADYAYYEESNEETEPSDVSSLSEEHKLLFGFEQSFLKNNYACDCLPYEEKLALLVTCNKIFHKLAYVEGMEDKFEKLAYGQQPPCPNNSDAEGAGDSPCKGRCCPFCCVMANKFTTLMTAMRTSRKDVSSLPFRRV